MENKAKFFARIYHEGQVRKYTEEPYINHPIAVAELVKSVPHTWEMVCAALLHDVVEDTEATLGDIEFEFGKNVAELVEMLTDISRKPEDGNRAKRKEIDRQHIAKANSMAKTIKIADLIDNTKTILTRDPNFAKVYLKEKLLLLDVLKEGDKTLWNIAYSMIPEKYKYGKTYENNSKNVFWITSVWN